jgi:type IV pilus assembly protein PilX
MISGNNIKPFGRRARQDGAILVTSLLLLLVVTIIGISVMQMTRMQERMSGNSRDVSIAFQGAESGLRGGETKVLGFANAPAACTASGGCATVYSKTALPDLGPQDDSWWKTSATTFTDPDIGAEFEDPPQFIIEQYAFVPYSREFGEITGRDFYQVSARSTGGTGNAQAVVQSTFARTAQ